MQKATIKMEQLMAHGHIGKKVAKIASAFGMNVLVNNRSEIKDIPEYIEVVNKTEIFKNMYIKKFDSRIAKELNLDRKVVREVITELERVIRERILFGESVSVNGVGKLSTAPTKETRKFHVQKQVHVMIPARMKLYFKPSNKLNEDLKKKPVYLG